MARLSSTQNPTRVSGCLQTAKPLAIRFWAALDIDADSFLQGTALKSTEEEKIKKLTDCQDTRTNKETKVASQVT